MTSRFLILVGITFTLAVLTALGLLYDAETAFVAFAAWCGGVLFTLTLEELQRAARQQRGAGSR